MFPIPGHWEVAAETSWGICWEMPPENSVPRVLRLVRVATVSKLVRMLTVVGVARGVRIARGAWAVKVVRVV